MPKISFTTVQGLGASANTVPHLGKIAYLLLRREFSREKPSSSSIGWKPWPLAPLPLFATPSSKVSCFFYFNNEPHQYSRGDEEDRKQRRLTFIATCREDPIPIPSAETVSRQPSDSGPLGGVLTEILPRPKKSSRQDGSSCSAQGHFPKQWPIPPPLTDPPKGATVSDLLRLHLLAGSLLGINSGLLTHSSQDNNV